MGLSKQTSASSQFEERVRNLLRNLGFTHIRGGSDYFIGDNQIDACGICDEKLLIIECTTQRKNHKEKILVFRGKTTSIKKGLDSTKEYRNFNNEEDLRFLYVSNSNNLEGCEELFDEPIIWNRSLLEYYEKNAKAVPSRAKYDLLSDMGFTRKTKEKFIIPAIKYKYENEELYSFFINPRELLKISYVARRETSKKDYYQRMIKPKRLKEIQREYLDKGGIFPTSICLGLNSEYVFNKIKNGNTGNLGEKNIELGLLELPYDYRSCWVIDGQHRLFSFLEKHKQNILALAFGNISTNRQAQYFVDINRKAKPIDPNLIWDLEGDLRSSSPQGVISNGVKKLNETEPLKEKIYIPSSSLGSDIKMASFCDALLSSDFGRDRISRGRSGGFVDNPFYSRDPLEFSNNIANGLSAYLQTLLNLVSGDEGVYLQDFLFDNGGISVFMYLFKIIICVNKGKNPTQKKIENYLDILVQYLKIQGPGLIKDYRGHCSSEGGKAVVLNDFLNIISEKHPVFTDYIKEEGTFNNAVLEIEGRLRELAVTKLNDLEIQEVKQNIKPEVYKEIQRRLLGEPHSVGEILENMGLGEIISLLFYSRFWTQVFKKMFLRGEEEVINANDVRFPDENLLKGNLSLLNKCRVTVGHGKKTVITFKDKDLIRTFVAQLNILFGKNNIL